MPLQSSGTIKISELATEFNDLTPNSLSEFYRAGGKVPDIAANSGVPTSGAISLSDFYGTQATNPVPSGQGMLKFKFWAGTYTNNLVRWTFDSSTSSRNELVDSTEFQFYYRSVTNFNNSQPAGFADANHTEYTGGSTQRYLNEGITKIEVGTNSFKMYGEAAAETGKLSGGTAPYAWCDEFADNNSRVKIADSDNNVLINVTLGNASFSTDDCTDNFIYSWTVSGALNSLSLSNATQNTKIFTIFVEE
jgi:hypothetical protein